MNIYFGEVTQEAAALYGGEFFEVEDRLFDFCLRTTNAEFVIEDSLNRSVPFSMDMVGELIDVLSTIQPMAEAIVEGQQAIDFLEDHEDICV